MTSQQSQEALSIIQAINKARSLEEVQACTDYFADWLEESDINVSPKLGLYIGAKDLATTRAKERICGIA